MQFSPSIKFVTNNVTNFIVEITQQCNMRCVYCCFSGKYVGRRTHSSKFMNDDILQSTIDYIVKNSNPLSKIAVSFFGGEALLRLTSIEAAVAKLNQIFGERITFDISTNGILLTNSNVMRILRLPRTGISVSLDGCESIHDEKRLDKSGEATYGRIVDNLKKFRSNYPEEYRKRIRILITAASVKDIEVMNENYNVLRSLLGDKPILLSKIMPNFNTGELYQDCYRDKQMFLQKASEFKKKGILNLYTLVLDDLLRKLRNRLTGEGEREQVCLYTCLNEMYSCFISSEGNIYPCEKFGKDFIIGNVCTGVNKVALITLQKLYCYRKNHLCSTCGFVGNCHRCLMDMSMTYEENKKMCNEYIENIQLSRMFADD